MASIYPDFQRTDYLIKALAENESQIKDVVPKAFYEAFSQLCETTISDLKVKPVTDSPSKKVAGPAKKVAKVANGEVRLRRIAGKVKKEFICMVCSKVNETATMLKTHFERNHKVKKDYVCSVGECRIAFASKSSLNLHALRSHGPRIHVCKLCPLDYAVLGDLRQHLRRGHGIY